MGDEENKSRHRDRERGHSHHRHRHHEDGDEDRHHRKKRRREDDEDRERSHRHRSHHKSHHKSQDRNESTEKKSGDPIDVDMKDDNPEESTVERESWMTGGSEDKVDPFSSFLGGQRKEKKPVEKPKPQEIGFSSREINTRLLKPPSPSLEPEEEEAEEKYTPPTYTIGDDGSSWRMMKLKNLRSAAKEAMRPVEEIAVERLGSLRAYDEAREEQKDLERRKLDRKGEGVLKVKVTGELYLQRLAKQQRKAQREQERNPPQPPTTATTATTDADKPITQSDLNKLQATLLRAEMSNAPAAATLAQEYALLVEKFNTQPPIPQIIALPPSHS